MKLYVYNGQSTNYSISKDGQVMNNTTGQYLKGQKNKNGYWSVNLSLPRDKKRLYIHRMVMETFAPNENGANLEVNHKDANKDNNTLENLEWVTSAENKAHAKENGLNNSKTIYGFDDNLELIISFRSIIDAYRAMGWSMAQLSGACNMNPKTKSYGYYWSFEKEPDFQIKEISSGKEKAIDKYDLNGHFIESYPSMSAAARANNCSRTHIGEVCNGKLKTYKGFIWKYTNKDIV